MESKRLFLLDAYALIFRAYYALIKMPRVTSSGFNTSAIFGFVNTLEELLRKERPTHLAVCFDPQGPTFRHEADTSYKAEREATPEDIKLSVPVIKKILEAYRIPVVEVEGFEADDVIGTLATRAEREGFTTYMMTPDKDFGQLVSANILQYKPSYRGQDFEIRGVDEICNRYGLDNPSQVIDLLALMGDKIDNIPGCPGVGEKTAVKLIGEFGSVDSLLEHTDRLKGALRKKVEDNAEQIRFSRFLATIRTDVPLATDPEDLKVRSIDKENLFAIFRDLEFRTLADRVEKRLREESGPASGTPSLFDFGHEGNEPEETQAVSDPGKDIPRNYTIVGDVATLDALRRRLLQTEMCGICLLTDGDSDMTADWIGSAIALAPGEAVFIPRSFAEGTAAVVDTMARADIRKITMQAKHDMIVTSASAPEIKDTLQNYYDITIAHYLLQPEMRHGEDLLASQYLGLTMHDPLAALSAKERKAGWRALPVGVQADTACERADIALRLYDPISKEVEKEGMVSLLADMELPLVRVLADMEMTGVRIDVPTLDAAATQLSRRLEDIEKGIYELVGEEFNVGSPARVGEILFGKLQLDPKAKKTKTGQYSTGEDVLEKIAWKHPVVGMILEYRQLKKLLNTYLMALPATINPKTGKIHTTYNQTVTATGRISSSNPNLQNIPVRDEEGREIRRAFIADPGHLFLSADYSQIELRLVADFADDVTMLDAFRHDKDIHAITAAKIYHKALEDVTPEERRHAKTANFGILYGISAFGLASRLNIPRADAKTLIDSYFVTFPSIRKYMTDVVEQARADGYVNTRFGRKRRLADINSRNPVVRGYAERNAINAPVQGTAADIIKRAMVDIFNEMRRRDMKSKMIMQVHDELNFDVVPDELPQLQELVAERMEKAYDGKVRLIASSGVGTNWLDAH